MFLIQFISPPHPKHTERTHGMGFLLDSFPSMRYKVPSEDAMLVPYFLLSSSSTSFFSSPWAKRQTFSQTQPRNNVLPAFCTYLVQSGWHIRLTITHWATEVLSDNYSLYLSLILFLPSCNRVAPMTLVISSCFISFHLLSSVPTVDIQFSIVCPPLWRWQKWRHSWVLQ